MKIIFILSAKGTGKGHLSSGSKRGEDETEAEVCVSFMRRIIFEAELIFELSSPLAIELK